MKRQTIFRAAFAVGALAIVVVGWRISQGDPEGRMLSGYIEGEAIYLAAPASGTVEAIYAREGDRIEAGGQTFLIDPGVQQAQERGANAAVEAARARADDLRKGQEKTQELTKDYTERLDKVLKAKNHNYPIYVNLVPSSKMPIWFVSFTVPTIIKFTKTQILKKICVVLPKLSLLNTVMVLLPILIWYSSTNMHAL